MNVAVFGAGYVGTVTAACLAELGHRVWLVEISPEKLALLREGGCPVAEPGLPEALGAALRAGRVVPTATAGDALGHAELSLLCVATPSRADGAPETRQLRAVLREIGRTLGGGRARPHVIALRSTLAAPSLRAELLPILVEELGARFGGDVSFAINPEFLREGKALEDFRRPPFVVIGTDHPAAATALRELYAGVDAPVHVVSPGTASLLKYACNAFHGLKVAFANEIASLETAFGAEADRVMELFCQDRALNISPAYLRPGYAFGGACLPKDLRALNRVASAMGIACPVFDSVLRSNDMLVQRSVDAISRLGVRAVALVGLSFKTGTDDLRESPLVGLAERLLGKGHRLRIFDPDVSPAALRGHNLRYAEEHLQHLTSLLHARPADALVDAELVVVGKPLLPLDRLIALRPPAAKILDLIRCFPPTAHADLVRLDGADLRPSPEPRDGA